MKKKSGIGKIYLTEHTDNEVNSEDGGVAFQQQLDWQNGKTSALISFSTSFLNFSAQDQPSLTINTKGEAHPFSATEFFLHELKHAVDTTYVQLEREESPLGFIFLHEYDAINFAGAACHAIEDAKNKAANPEKELSPSRDPFLYGAEGAIARGEISYPATHEESRTAMSYRILKERGLFQEAQALLDLTPEGKLGYVIGTKNQTLRDVIRSETHDIVFSKLIY